MSELTDLKAELVATKASMQVQHDWNNGVTRAYFSSGKIQLEGTEYSLAEWTGAGRDAFLDYHNGLGTNANALDQIFVDMYAEKQATTHDGVDKTAGVMTMNATLLSDIATEITALDADLAHLQTRIDAGEEALQS